MQKVVKKVGIAIIAMVFFVVIWQFAVVKSRISTALFPSPLQVWQALLKLLLSGELLEHIQASMYRFVIGYTVAVFFGIVFGMLLGWLRNVALFFQPLIQLLRPISPMAWLPFIVLWFGIGDIPAIVIIFIAAFFPVLLATIGAVRSVDPTYIKVASNFGIKQPWLLTKIIFPAAFPRISSGIHLAIGTAWIFLVAGEMVGAQSGLGYLIIDARNELDVAVLMAAMIIIGVLGLLLDSLVNVVEKRIFQKWGVTH